MLTGCDFCFQRPAAWSYLVSPFEIPPAFIGEVGPADSIWHACTPCHELIETESWIGLAAVSARNLPRPPNVYRRTWRHLKSNREQWCREVVTRFAAHRIGDATPLLLDREGVVH